MLLEYYGVISYSIKNGCCNAHASQQPALNLSYLNENPAYIKISSVVSDLLYL